MKKKTLVLGASSNIERYSNKAIKMLTNAHHPVLAIGAREDEAYGIKIYKNTQDFKEIDTITLYLSPKNQVQFYNYILGLKPKRILFNPGTENDELKKLAQSHGIETEEACTLVLLSTHQY